MNDRQRLADKLRQRKGLSAKTDLQEPTSERRPRTQSRRRRPQRYQGTREFQQLRASLRAARKRASKAERALARWLRSRIYNRPQKHGRGGQAPIRMRTLQSAWRRIEKLEAENERLRKQIRARAGRGDAQKIACFK